MAEPPLVWEWSVMIDDLSGYAGLLAFQNGMTI